jgi:hypothetical protein
MFDIIDDDTLFTVSGGARCDLSGLPSAAQQIIQRESGGNPLAKNPTSSAFGLGQLIVANRKALMGSNYASTDCGDQIQAFSKYTLGRYGSYDRALSFHKRNGWY